MLSTIAFLILAALFIFILNLAAFAFSCLLFCGKLAIVAALGFGTWKLVNSFLR